MYMYIYKLEEGCNFRFTSSYTEKYNNKKNHERIKERTKQKEDNQIYP